MRLTPFSPTALRRPLSSRLVPKIPHQKRPYAFQTSGIPTSFQVFNNRTKWLQRERAASNAEASRQADYLKDEVAMRVAERLLDVKRTFPLTLDFGAYTNSLARALTNPNPDPSQPDADIPPLATKIGKLVAADSSQKALFRDAKLEFNKEINMERVVLPYEEGPLPWEDNTFDMVLSSLSMHWINDLPGVLGQINRILKPDAPFIGAMLGGDTLFELRTSLQLAEQERRGGIGVHVSPLADVKDVGGLLGKAGFKMLTVDVEDIVVEYPDTFALMEDLQAMGEGNAVLGREVGAIGKDVLLAAEGIYRELHGSKDEDGTVRLPATFRVIHMIGWKEGGDQPKPLPRGSGEINLRDVLGTK
ncbi:Putative Methyltransferase [Podospora comata]|uniref:Methyltransferase n=1 Tax=Podospora comata TaxID=48703 RepID=A0ABY6SFM9_PODCO|nr:Putative Methyltransferase [Podospora comata]